jgi:superfamily II DNA or RNA helicase
MAFVAGDRVTVRGERWVVQEATAYGYATLLGLSRADDRHGHRHCCLLSPFDHPVATRRSLVIRTATRRRWMRHLHAHLSEVRAFGELRVPQRAAMDILPFQLEPALALARGRATRFLLADEVGLGKTIQAGLMLAELRQRGWCDHALIITPAGLRQQWADELLHRFDMRAAVMDAASLAALTDSLPFDVNPWTGEPVFIASIDFLKQSEVLHGLASLLWDVLIVDEAHQATIASLRYDAVDTLAKRARHVMLLTATPHAGDDRAYRALCAIGEVAEPLDGARSGDDPILLFRRTRELAGLPRSRRVHLLPVKTTPAGVEMHRLLEGYLAQLWTIAREPGKRDVQLVAMVLAKRAFSSARSLATSLERRMAALTGKIDVATQGALPLSFEDEASDDVQLPIAPAFERTDDERTVLGRLLDAARKAQSGERKMDALRRIVRRVGERLIIFTEYRDTLDAIRDAIGGLRRLTTLHGGQTAHERLHSLRAFTNGAADVMIATDAGSEGLNLQGACRLVVNLELPWNPIRLEQRIGRVDRIGQARTVHAINLLAEGTAERTVLASLLRRIDRIRLSEIEIAACVISRSEPPSRSVHVETRTQSVDLGIEARAAAQQIADARRFGAVCTKFRDEIVPVTVIKSRDTSLISFFRVRLVTGAGRLIEDRLLPVRLPLDRLHFRLGRKEALSLAESLIARFGPELLRHAHTHADERVRAITLDAAESIATSAERERRIAHFVAADDSPLVQAGLFDSRALKQKLARGERREAVRRESKARAHLLEADSGVRVAQDPELVMLLIQCSQG